MSQSIFVDHFCDVQGSRHLLSFGYDDHLSSGPEVQEEEREGGTADTPEVPEIGNEKYQRLLLRDVQLAYMIIEEVGAGKEGFLEVPEMRRKTGQEQLTRWAILQFTEGRRASEKPEMRQDERKEHGI